MTPLTEGIVQVRGTGGDRQVPGATTAFVGGIGGRIDHHAFLVLDREPQ
jgi:thiamine pyrophosphokinase